jgi:hypothetical protein
VVGWVEEEGPGLGMGRSEWVANLRIEMSFEVEAIGVWRGKGLTGHLVVWRLATKATA